MQERERVQRRSLKHCRRSVKQCRESTYTPQIGTSVHVKQTFPLNKVAQRRCQEKSRNRPHTYLSITPNRPHTYLSITPHTYLSSPLHHTYLSISHISTSPYLPLLYTHLPLHYTTHLPLLSITPHTYLSSPLHHTPLSLIHI